MCRSPPRPATSSSTMSSEWQAPVGRLPHPWSLRGGCPRIEHHEYISLSLLQANLGRSYPPVATRIARLQLTRPAVTQRGTQPHSEEHSQFLLQHACWSRWTRWATPAPIRPWPHPAADGQLDKQLARLIFDVVVEREKLEENEEERDKAAAQLLLTMATAKRLPAAWGRRNTVAARKSVMHAMSAHSNGTS